MGAIRFQGGSSDKTFRPRKANSPTSPTSPTTRVGSGKRLELRFFFSLHFLCSKTCWQPKTQHVQQNLMMIGRACHAACSYFVPRIGREHHVHQPNLRRFKNHSPWLVSQASFLAKLPKRFPKNIRQETYKYVSSNSLFFVMPYRSDAQIRLLDSECIFRSC